jgi:hypothetical protein
LLRKKPGNKWNDYSEICDKNLDMVLRPQILKNEEEATEKLRQQLEKSQFQEYLKDKYNKIMHDVIYYDGRRAFDKNRKKYGISGQSGRLNYSSLVEENSIIAHEKSSTLVDYELYLKISKQRSYSQNASRSIDHKLGDDSLMRGDEVVGGTESNKQLILKLFQGRNPEELDEFG